MNESPKRQRRHPRICFVLMILVAIPFMFLACAASRPLEKKDPAKGPLEIAREAQTLTKKPSPKEGEVKEAAPSESELPSFQIIQGYRPEDRASSAPAKADHIEFDRQKKVRLTIEDMPLTEFIDFFFGKLMGVSYTLHPLIQQMGGNKININLQKEASLGQLYPLVMDLLQECGVSVSFQDGVFRILPTATQQSMRPYVRWGADGGDAGTSSMVIQIMPVRYMGEGVQDIMGLIQNAQQKLRVSISHSKELGLLMIIGSEQDVRAAVSLVGLLDRPCFSGQNIAMVRLKYWNPEDFVKKMEAVLKAEGVGVSSEIQSQGVTMIPVGRLRAVLCFSPEAEWLQRVRYWHELLDVPSQTKAQESFFVYFPQHARAEELGEVLSKMLSMMGKAHKEEKTTERALDMTRREATPRGGQSAEAPAVGTETKKSEGKASAKKTAGVVGSSKGDVGELNVAVVVDDVRNALIIYSSPDDYGIIKALLEQIDIMPRQVLIEVTVAEVTLKDSLQFGVEWYLKNSVGSVTETIGTLGGLGLPTGGLSYSLISDSKKFQAMLTMLAKQTDIRILSTPHVMIRDNESATIKIGQDVPVLVSATTSDIQQQGDTQIIQSVEYRATGVMLTVTPTINSRDMVTLDISQEVSEAQTNTVSKVDSPLILDRSVQTKVLSRHGQSILLGGIISDKTSRNINKVPFLGDIPLLGYLFKTESTGRDKSEVIMLVTPHILSTDEDIDAVRREIISRMHMLDEKQTGRFR